MSTVSQRPRDLEPESLKVRRETAPGRERYLRIHNPHEGDIGK